MNTIQKDFIAAGARAIREAVAARAAHGPVDRADRTGILLVTFGTSVRDARAAFDNVGSIFAGDFAGIPMRWAVTSPIIRHKLALEGEETDSTSLALAGMLDDGFTQVAVQSLHTIPGVEYRQLLAQVRAFERIPDGFVRLTVGKPLLHDDADLEEAALATLRCLPADRRPGEAVVLMGHGTWHPGKAFYGRVHERVRTRDPLVWVGAMEGALAVEEIAAELAARGVRRAFLAPFMSVAGEHAVNDMAGESLDSWRNVLASAGVEVVPVMKGTAEFKDFVHIWAGHLRDALARLEKDASV